jgi:hypothetical protein
MRDAVFCDSNYLPALDAAAKLLAVGFHETCALSIFFLSDGESTDAREMNVTPAAAQRKYAPACAISPQVMAIIFPLPWSDSEARCKSFLF